MSDIDTSSAENILSSNYSDKVFYINDKNGKTIRVLSEELIKNYSAELVDFLIDKSREKKDFAMASRVLQQLIEVKKAYWPATQKSLQTNIDIFDVQLDKWKKARDELKEMEVQNKSTEQIQIISGEKELDTINE